MNAILILIPVTLVLVGVAIWAFFWATNGGQFDDLDTPGLSILGDDDRAPPAPREAPPSGTDA
jgi:cbb3-type cytochrome oxidase maturation protein